MTKLAIVEDREEDKFEHFTVTKCWLCDPEKGLELPQLSDEPPVRASSRSVSIKLIDIGQSSRRQCPEVVVIGTSIRSTSMGRGDRAL